MLTMAGVTCGATGFSQPTEIAEAEVYAAYYEVLSDALKIHGDATAKEIVLNNIVPNGIFHTELIDFNNDGVPALLINQGNPENGTLYVYGYVDGKAKLLFSQWIRLIPDSGGSFTISTHKSGINYFILQEGGLNYQSTYYYMIDNGEWVCDLSIKSTGPIQGEFVFEVNGEEANIDEYRAVIGFRDEFVDNNDIALYGNIREDFYEFSRSNNTDSFYQRQVTEVENMLNRLLDLSKNPDTGDPTGWQRPVFYTLFAVAAVSVLWLLLRKKKN